MTPNEPLPEDLERTAGRRKAQRKLTESAKSKRETDAVALRMTESLRRLNSHLARNGYTERLRESITGRGAA